MSLADLSHLPLGTIGVAVSGGIDSMCLLHDLVQEGVQVVAVTINHGIRGKESEEDCLLVQRFAAQLGVACMMHTVDAPDYCAKQHLGLEEGARKLRYSYFDSLLQEGKVACIATAHQADDQAESVLLNILRGTGIRGLAGIRDRAGYVRPLIGVTRAQIEAYARANQVPYRTDSTNQDDNYRRNFLRLQVLPLLAIKYPDVGQKLARLAEVAQREMEVLDNMAVRPHSEGSAMLLPLCALEQPAALSAWSIGLAVRPFDNGVDFEERHYTAVTELASKSNGAKLDLPKGLVATKEYDCIAFWRPPHDLPTYPFGEGRYAFGDATVVVRPYIAGDRLRFDADKIPQGARIRPRQAGDTIVKFGGGTKSLGDYYTDNKIPTRVRDTAPVVAVGNTVLVCPVDIAETVKVTAQTQRILTLTYGG